MGTITRLNSHPGRRPARPGSPQVAASAVPPQSVPLAPGIDRLPTWVPPHPNLAEVLAGASSGIGTALARPLLTGPARALFGPLRPRSPAAGGRPVPGSRSANHALVDGGLGADPGWFGPGSVAWKVHADASMFVAGITAFALQALHPLALAGVADHGSFAEDFLGRVQRTGEFVQGVVYGTADEAVRRCQHVRQVHNRVVGTAPDGRPYDANDADLLEWVHLGEYLAIAAAYRRFGAYPLGPGELDRYVAEVAIVGQAVGVPSPPRSWAELDAALQRFRPVLAVGEQGAAAFRFLKNPPGLPAAVRPVWRVAFAGAMACLPPQARLLLRVSEPNPVELVACRSMVRSISALLGPPPPLLAARARLGLTA